MLLGEPSFIVWLFFRPNFAKYYYRNFKTVSPILKIFVEATQKVDLQELRFDWDGETLLFPACIEGLQGIFNYHNTVRTFEPFFLCS